MSSVDSMGRLRAASRQPITGNIASTFSRPTSASRMSVALLSLTEIIFSVTSRNVARVPAGFCV